MPPDPERAAELGASSITGPVAEDAAGANIVYSIGNHPKNDWFVLSASRRIKLGWNG